MAIVAEHYEIPSIDRYMETQDYVKAIEAGEASPEQNPELHAKLASCYFYIGNYEKSREHALLSGDRAFYKLSGVLRAQKRYAEARKLLEENPPPTQRVVGQHYLNLGAAYADDPRGDLDKAIYYYGKALGELTGDLLVRLKIRIARAQVLAGRPQEATHILDDIQASGKTKVHLLMVQAEVLECLKREAVAQAMPIATQLGLRPDVQRLKSL